MSPIQLPRLELVQPTRSVASLLCRESLVILVLGLLVGVADLFRPQLVWALLATSLAYARYYTHSLPFEVKLANASLKTLFILAIDVARHCPLDATMCPGSQKVKGQGRFPEPMPGPSATHA